MRLSVGSGMNNRVLVRLYCFRQDCTQMFVIVTAGTGDVQEPSTVCGQMYVLLLL
jgi:hypothetical protein